ncbi:MAG: Crp/Fnr family transcriptional regulator [Cyclobacteriaceae bacterium]|nr:Crp/Fnr family transcriptional regulator [Cyclobacteriaceae bacterium]
MLSNLRSENYRLRTDHIFHGISQKDYDTIVSSGVTHVYRKGEVIFREGGIPTGIFYINKGWVKKYTLTHKGAEQIFYICGEGEILGYHALLGENLYPDSAATIADSEIAFIPKEAFLKVIHHSVLLSNRLLKALGKEFTLSISSMTHLATKTVKERLAINLLILDEKYKAVGKVDRPEIVMSRTDFASLVGTAKETLVRLLQEFAQAGMIEKTSQSVKVISRKKLVKVANLVGVGKL